MTNTRNRLLALVVALIFVQCANAVEGIGTAFRGNTQRDPRDYNLEVRSNYRRYRIYKKLVEQDEEKEVLERMHQTDGK